MDRMKKVTCRRHWMFNAKAGIVMVFFLLGALGYIQSKEYSGAFITAAIGIVIFGISFVISMSDYLTISNNVVTGHRGIIKSQTLKSPVSKVQDVSISNGLLGKIFGYHTITVNTAGSNGAEYVFKCMANAKQFQSAFASLVNEHC